MNNGMEAGGFSVERHKREIGETWLGVIYEPSLPLLGEPLA
jgi:hypothetical protein